MLRHLKQFLSPLLLSTLFISACSDPTPTEQEEPPPPIIAGEFQLVSSCMGVPSSQLRSYPGGGGIFTLSIQTSPDFSGAVFLHVRSAPGLGLKLQHDILDRNAPVTDIDIAPESTLPTGQYDVEVTAMHGDTVRTIVLHVEITHWEHGPPDMDTKERDRFIQWLEAAHPELGVFTGIEWRRYISEPEILIVTHWAFTNPAWELQLKYHVMIPPHDWARMRLRRRGDTQPLLAAERRTDGSIREIPVSEYM